MTTQTISLHPDSYQDNDESFALYLNNLVRRYQDNFLAFAAKNNVQLVRTYEDSKGQNLWIEGWNIDEFLGLVEEADHSHIVVKSLVPNLTGGGNECIVLVIDMYGNCNAVYIKRVLAA